MEEKNDQIGAFARTIDWRQGLSIAIGVPLLILPSIGYFTKYVWAFSIFIWLFSIFQGFMQNLAYGEMASMFPDASGLPGFAQEVFKELKFKRWELGKLIGGFSAWSYWFAWNAVLAIFSLLIGQYLHGLIPAFASIDLGVLSLLAGIIIFTLLIVISYFGLAGGAVLGYILSFLSIIPLIALSVMPFIKGNFHLANINNSFLPTDWNWDFKHIMILFGIMAMAQWSACAWETAAIYAPEYKNPKKDIPKALFYCGFICIFTFLLVQTACIGALGVEAVIAEPFSPMLLLARQSFGEIGALITVLMLIASMVLIIQTAFLGSARAMHSMAKEGNLPKIFGKTNKYGTPIFAMIFTALFNLGLIFLKTPSAILSASAIGYVFANGISLFAFYKAYNDKKFVQLSRDFRAPKGWGKVALFFGILNIPLYLFGIMILNSIDMGW